MAHCPGTLWPLTQSEIDGRKGNFVDMLSPPLRRRSKMRRWAARLSPDA